MSTREYDIVLWGATGFTGRLVAIVFARHYGVDNSSIRLALAGRSKGRLEEVAQLMLNEALQSSNVEIKQKAEAIQNSSKEIVPIVELKTFGLDKDETNQMAHQLCSKTNTIVALAGPFEECGEPIVEAAAECGTDYVDITGELQWIALMRSRYDSKAKLNKARIIPCCGFDFILNDLGVFLLQDYAKSRQAPPVKVIDQLCKVTGSRPSGGTLRTMFRMCQSISMKSLLSGQMNNPFILCERVPSKDIIKQNSDLKFIRFSPLANQWMVPSIMGPGMKRYMHWVNDIQDSIYGSEFIYRAGDRTTSFVSGFFQSLFLGVAVASLFVASRINFIAKRLASAPGEGRHIKELERPGNEVEVQTVGIVRPATSDPIKVDYTITFKKGEAYLLTAYGALEAAIACLKARRNELPDKGYYGVGAPSNLLGMAVVDQIKTAGFEINLKETSLEGA